MLDQLNRYLRMIKFSHTIFALPFAGIAFIEALPYTDLVGPSGPTAPFYWMVLKIILAMFSLRSAAMGFNRIVDRHIDEKNPRTAGREIPSGKISLQKARLFVIFFTVVFVLTAFWINLLAGQLSPVAVFIVFFYSYTKRFTMFAHFVLGIGIGLAPVATWIALTGSIALLPVLWSLGLALYIGGFDILYSCQDADFDRDMGLYSIPSRLGVSVALWISRISHVASLILFVQAGIISPGPDSVVFFLTVALVGILFLTEHVMVRPDRLDRVPIAFFHVNAAISSVLFAGLLIEHYVI